VTAIREGRMDFLAKPVDPDHLLLMGSERSRSGAC
jgi:FixJ family two-component response regulator